MERRRFVMVVVLTTLLGLGVAYVSVSASACQKCLVTPCYVPTGEEVFLKVNKSLCATGSATGLAFMAVAICGLVATVRRWPPFHGAYGVSFVLAFQGALCWGLEIQRLTEFETTYQYDYYDLGDDFNGYDFRGVVRIEANKAVLKRFRFLLAASIIIGVGVLAFFFEVAFATWTQKRQDADRRQDVNRAVVNNQLYAPFDTKPDDEDPQVP